MLTLTDVKILFRLLLIKQSKSRLFLRTIQLSHLLKPGINFVTTREPQKAFKTTKLRIMDSEILIWGLHGLGYN